MVGYSWENAIEMILDSNDTENEKENSHRNLYNTRSSYEESKSEQQQQQQNLIHNNKCAEGYFNCFCFEIS